MNWTIIKSFIEYIQEYTASNVFGYIRLIIDIAIIVAAVIVVYRTLARYTNSRVMMVLTLGLLGLLVVIVALDLQILFKLYPFIVLIVIGVWLFYNSSKLKTIFSIIYSQRLTQSFWYSAYIVPITAITIRK